MPYSVWVTRAASSDHAHSEAVKALTGPLAPGDSSLDLPRPAFEQWLTSLQATRHEPDHAWWVRYPREHSAAGAPWFSVFTTPRAGPLRHVELSACYSNPEFMRNMLDMHDEGFRLARRLGGSLFPEQRNELKTFADVTAFLDFDGPFVTSQFDFFRSGQEALRNTSHAPLEFPLGVIDTVPDYFRFDLRMPDVPTTLDELAPGLPAHLVARESPAGEVLLLMKGGRVPLVRVILFEDGVIVRPAWSRSQFATMARATLETIESLQRYFNAEVTYRGHGDQRVALSAELRERLTPQPGDLGVSFYEDYVLKRGVWAG